VNLRRLLQMTPTEIGGRARQETSKWVDRHFSGLYPRDQIDAPPGPLWSAAAFFRGAQDERTGPLLDRRAPRARHRILSEAEALLRGHFDLLGYRHLDFGQPVDWHLDPVSGRRAPVRHWSTLDPLDGETLGDSKVTWELNRHQWMVRLGQAYRLSRDERFAQAFCAHLLGWMSGNPRGVGINWTSSLEVAFRLISWTWALHLFQGSPSVGPELRSLVSRSLWQHAAHVERYLSHYFSPNTHLTGEALGLVYAGTLLSHLPRAKRWQTLGSRILGEQSGQQILGDGVYFEQSTCYQRYTAEIYLHFIILAELNGIPVPADVRASVARLLDALLVLLRPDGAMPSIGDADGGWLLPLDQRASSDARGVFSTAAVVFRRPDYAWAAGELAPETLWLLGPAAVATFDGLVPRPPEGGPTRALEHGGYVILRTDWRADADQVILDTGPLGCPHSSGHGHADLLGVQCSFRGRPYVVDPGTFRYTTADGWRDHFRTTGAHSTVEVDGVGQAIPKGPFAWDSRPESRLVRWQTTDTLDYAEAEHSAYERLPDPVLHRRLVVLTRSGYCVVLDDLVGRTEHRLDLRFQLAPMPATLDSDQWVRAGEPGETGLLMRAFASLPLETTIAQGHSEPLAGWVSSDYGVRGPAPSVVYSMVGRLPARILTLLLPVDRLEDPPLVAPMIEGDSLIGLRLVDLGETLRLDGPVPRLETR